MEFSINRLCIPKVNVFSYFYRRNVKFLSKDKMPVAPRIVRHQQRIINTRKNKRGKAKGWWEFAPEEIIQVLWTYIHPAESPLSWIRMLARQGNQETLYRGKRPKSTIVKDRECREGRGFLCFILGDFIRPRGQLAELVDRENWRDSSARPIIHFQCFIDFETFSCRKCSLVYIYPFLPLCPVASKGGFIHEFSDALISFFSIAFQL